MNVISYQGKNYEMDDQGFLLDYREWDEGFARAMASKLDIRDLTPLHWQVIRLIRTSFEMEGRCPSVFQVCRQSQLHLDSLKKLFPTGYLRGACKLAGITYKEGYVKYSWVAAAQEERRAKVEKTYQVDLRGFLADPASWDRDFAVFRAEEIGIPGGFTPRHWQIINYLRESFFPKGAIPTVFQTCEDNHLELEELELLFPAGYHRGAVKLSGLRQR